MRKEEILVDPICEYPRRVPLRERTISRFTLELSNHILSRSSQSEVKTSQLLLVASIK